MNKSGFLAKIPIGTVKKFVRRAKKKGCRFALRASYVELRQKFGGRMPLVSFVLPVYNVEKYLPQCLDSLIRQTMRHIEIICVDDGSTDRSLEILNEYAAKDCRIKVFSQKNKFAGAARNLGLSKASGEYVVFLDSDDFFDENLAKSAYYAAKLNKADVVIFGADRFDNSTGQYMACPRYCNVKKMPKERPFSWEDCPEKFFQITKAEPWNKMIHRRFILDADIQFQTLHNTNDALFIFSALTMARRIVTVNQPLVHYRVGMSTNLQSVKKREPLCFYEAYKALHDKLLELGVLDALRQSYVNLALNSCGYNLDSVRDDDARQVIYNKLRNGGFEELELLGHDPEYYYKMRRYQQMVEIMADPVGEETSLTAQ